MDSIFKFSLKTSIVLPLLLSSFWSFGQKYVHTPNGSVVMMSDETETLTNEQKEYWRQYCTTNYPNAIYMGEATSTYNCHAYAWSVSEGGEKGWMNDPSPYMTDGSYVRTSSSDPKASKVYYFGGNHSAVKLTRGGTGLISKWGRLCLMKHDPRDCPYVSDDLRYYKLSMEIIGDKYVTLPDSATPILKTYTLSNVPEAAEVSWSISKNGRIVSGQGTSRVQIELLCSGHTSLKASVCCASGLVVRPESLSIESSSAPIITDIELFKYSQNIGEFTLRAVTRNTSGTFEWYVAGGRAEFCELPYPDDATFALYPNIFTAIIFYSAGTYTITVRGINPQNMDTYTYSKDFVVTEFKSSRPPHSLDESLE